MSLVFKTPKSALNTTTGTLQNMKSGDCPAPSLTTESVEYTENGEYSVTTPQGYDGLSRVSVTVNIDTEAIADEAYAEGEADQKAKLTSLSVSSNGTYNREDGYNAVTVNVPSDINNQNKTVTPSTSSQSVTADSGYSGLGTVTVNAVTSSIDANIQSGNILDGVTILGVTGTAIEANLDSASFDGDMVGNYTMTPEGRYNGFDEVSVYVDPNPAGCFWEPIDISDISMMAGVYHKYDEGGYFDGMDVYFCMEVETGSIDSRTGNYLAEGDNGSAFYIHPYIENPDFDPEQPEDPTTNPSMIFPDDFDLSGLVIQVETPWENVTITENAPADPMEDPTYTVEIDECDIVGINWNGDSESWAFGTLEIDQNGVFDPKGFAEIEVNVSGGSNCPDWSTIGWTCSDVNEYLSAEVAYTQQKVADRVNNPSTSFEAYYGSDSQLVFLPTNFAVYGNGNSTFKGDNNLKYIPATNGIKFYSGEDPITHRISNAIELNRTFEDCSALREITLNLTDYGNGSQSNGYVGSGLNAFRNCRNLEIARLQNANGLRTFNGTFYQCINLKEVYITGNLSNLTTTEQMFYGCTSLVTAPAVDTSNVTGMSQMFAGCTNLTTLPSYDASKVTTVNAIFGYSYNKCPNLTTLGGFTNLGKAFTGTNANNHTLDFQYSPLITYQSIMNVINNLAAPDDTTATDATLILSAASYALLSASDIAVATAKNWTVTSA